MPLSVLVVDSSSNGPCVLKDMLRKNACETVACSSAAGALILLSENPSFDLIVFATTVADATPSQFCQKLRADGVANHIPVLIAGSATVSAEVLMEALASGAAGLLDYDVNPAVFMATVHSLAAKNGASGRNGDANGLGNDLTSLLKEYSALSHAVNNPLQAILANTDLLTLRLPEDSPLLKYTQSICESGDRVSKMVFEASQKAKAILNRAG